MSWGDELKLVYRIYKSKKGSKKVYFQDFFAKNSHAAEACSRRNCRDVKTDDYLRVELFRDWRYHPSSHADVLQEGESELERNDPYFSVYREDSIYLPLFRVYFQAAGEPDSVLYFETHFGTDTGNVAMKFYRAREFETRAEIVLIEQISEEKFNTSETDRLESGTCTEERSGELFEKKVREYKNKCRTNGDWW